MHLPQTLQDMVTQHMGTGLYLPIHLEIITQQMDLRPYIPIQADLTI